MQNNIIENNTSSQEKESIRAELHEAVLKPLQGLWEKYPLAWKETKQMLPDIVKTSEQAGIYMPVVFVSFLMDIIQYYHCQEMLQLSKKEFKLRKSHTRLMKEKHEFNKLAISKGEIPDHIFQQVQECQKLEEQEASL